MNEIAEQSVSTELERQAVITIIMSDSALSEMRQSIDVSLFSNFMNKNVVTWCLDYYDKYHKAPKYSIRDIYSDNVETLDDTTAELIELFLSDISDHYAAQDEFDENFMTDQLVKYLNIAKGNLLIEEVGKSVDLKNPESIIEKVKSFEPITRNNRKIVSLGELLKSEESEDSESLFEYPGVLGSLLGSFDRSSFTAILSPEKRGKTFFLLYFARLAAKKRRRVLFISAGDMTLREIAKREKLTLTGIPQGLKETQVVYKPVLDCRKNHDGSCMEKDTDKIVSVDEKTTIPEIMLKEYPEHCPCTECRGKNDSDFEPCVWWEKIEQKPLGKEQYNELLRKEYEKFEKQCGNHGAVLYEFFPTATCAPEDIENILKQEKENGTPIDVLIIDYMDILASPSRAKRMDERNRINATWEEIRRISQVYELAVITATQGVRAMYNDDADQGSTSEDKRKAAHVTCMFALNQKPIEKSQGIIRISPLFRRDGDCDLNKEAKVLTCFGLGKAYLSSFMSYKLFKNKKDAKSSNHSHYSINRKAKEK